ncbi:hypothetical protein DFR71_6232 [Nocardia alba]|uniref:Uncharacterized protein n=1 Tax=Nocardia alba TaxID=225051 RepID=A0A4R1FAW1_9NOCA|nr:hypothetical protein DFR71_6232 [Nocardia alba]
MSATGSAVHPVASVDLDLAYQRPKAFFFSIRYRGDRVGDGQQQGHRARSRIDDNSALDRGKDVAGLGQHQRGQLSGVRLADA